MQRNETEGLIAAESPAIPRRTDDSRARHIVAVISLLLAAGTFALYARSLGGEILTWDDDINLWFTPQIRSLELSSLAWMFTDTEQVLRYKPLCWLVWSSMIQAFGEAGPFRLPNVLLHSINAVLLFRLFLGFNRRSDDPVGFSQFAIAGSLAAFWAWSPARIEPVTWISGLGYPLAMTFCLASALFYRRALNDRDDGPLPKFLALSLGTWVLGLLSYPSALCALPFFPLLALSNSKNPSIWKALKLSSGHIVLGSLVAVGTLLMRIRSPGVWAGSSLTSVDLSEQVARGVYFPLWALGQTNPLTMIGPIHDGMTHPSLDLPIVWAGGLVLILITIVLLRFKSRAPILLWIAFLAALVPHLQLTEELCLPSHRSVYTASVFLLLIISSTAFALRHRTQRVIAVSMMILALATAPISWSQATIWRTNRNLFLQANSQVTTDLFRGEVLFRLGRVAQAEGDLEDAERFYRNSAEVSAMDARPHIFLAGLISKQGRLDEAAKHYRKALAIDPKDTTLVNNFGVILIQSERYQEAVTVLETGVAENPSPTLLTNLATAHARSGDLARATELLTDEMCSIWQPAKDLRAAILTDSRRRD